MVELHKVWSQKLVGDLAEFCGVKQYRFDSEREPEVLFPRDFPFHPPEDESPFVRLMSSSINDYEEIGLPVDPDDIPEEDHGGDFE